jgi:hypothetical protein
MEYITKIIGVKVYREPWTDIQKIPYYLTEKYLFESVKIDKFHCLFLKPVGVVDDIRTIQKQLHRLREVCESPIVFELPSISRQRMKSFIDLRIAFIIEDKQLYLPFIGVYLQTQTEHESIVSPGIEKLKPSAQMLLFAFILRKNKPMILSEMTKQLGFSAMSMSRAAEQLAKACLVQKQHDGVKLILKSDLTPRSLYQKAERFLINPVRKTVYLHKNMINSKMFPAGLSALAARSMLSPPELAVWGTAQKASEIREAENYLYDADQQIKLELWKYDPRKVRGDDQIDALSLAESLKDNLDDRSEMMIDEMLAEVL